MSTLLTRLFDLIFPPRTNQILLRQYEKTSITSLMKVQSTEGIITLSNYANPLIRAAIQENKYHNSPKARWLLSKILQEWSKSQVGEIIFVPIPLGPKRFKERGHNQVESILLGDKNNPLPYLNLLKRSVETTPQTKLERKERLSNVVGIFTINKTIEIPTKTRLIIVDDVTTTGATLKSAFKTLKAELPEDTTLECLAIAH